METSLHQSGIPLFYPNPSSYFKRTLPFSETLRAAEEGRLQLETDRCRTFNAEIRWERIEQTD